MRNQELVDEISSFLESVKNERLSFVLNEGVIVFQVAKFLKKNEPSDVYSERCLAKILDKQNDPSVGYLSYDLDVVSPNEKAIFEVKLLKPAKPSGDDKCFSRTAFSSISDDIIKLASCGDACWKKYLIVASELRVKWHTLLHSIPVSCKVRIFEGNMRREMLDAAPTNFSLVPTPRLANRVRDGWYKGCEFWHLAKRENGSFRVSLFEVKHSIRDICGG